MYIGQFCLPSIRINFHMMKLDLFEPYCLITTSMLTVHTCRQKRALCGFNLGYNTSFSQIRILMTSKVPISERKLVPMKSLLPIYIFSSFSPLCIIKHLVTGFILKQNPSWKNSIFTWNSNARNVNLWERINLTNF